MNALKQSYDKFPREILISIDDEGEADIQYKGFSDVNEVKKALREIINNSEGG